MMSPGDFIKLQVIEIVFLGVLAFLPFFVALREVGLTLMAIGLMVGGYRLVKKKMMKRVSVEGKSVLVTGCDTGIGHSLAKRLSSLGFRVFAGCYQPDGEGAESLKAGRGDTLHIVPLDVTSDDSVAKALQYVKERLDGTVLWAVVNNAGQNSSGDIEFCTLDVFKRIMDINMFGVVRVTRAFLPLVRRCKGRFINVTSVRGRMAGPQTAAYTTAKYAEEGFSDVLRVEMRQWGVKVVIIEPGNFGTTTALNKGQNLERVKHEIQRMWDEASSEAKEDYGKDYLFSICSDLSGAGGTSGNTVAPVVDAMEDALVNEEPKARYLIGGSNQLFDIYKLVVLINTFLPEFVTDFVIEWRLWADNPIPRALKTR